MLVNKVSFILKGQSVLRSLPKLRTVVTLRFRFALRNNHTIFDLYFFLENFVSIASVRKLILLALRLCVIVICFIGDRFI